MVSLMDGGGYLEEEFDSSRVCKTKTLGCSQEPSFVRGVIGAEPVTPDVKKWSLAGAGFLFERKEEYFDIPHEILGKKE